MDLEFNTASSKGSGPDLNPPMTGCMSRATPSRRVNTVLYKSINEIIATSVLKRNMSVCSVGVGACVINCC